VSTRPHSNLEHLLESKGVDLMEGAADLNSLPQLARFQWEVLRHGGLGCLPSGLSDEWLAELEVSARYYLDAQETRGLVGRPHEGQLAILAICGLLASQQRVSDSQPVAALANAGHSIPDLVQLYHAELLLEMLSRRTNIYALPAGIESILRPRQAVLHQFTGQSN
jgi:hypothetical protein